MGTFKTKNIHENTKRPYGRDAKENTPAGYVREDFNRTAKEHGAGEAGIFRYRDRLVVPMQRPIGYLFLAAVALP